MRVIILGFFDGMHKGHIKLTEKANQVANLKAASSAIFTFDVHPKTKIIGEEHKYIISSKNHKAHVQNISKVDEVIIYPFTDELKAMEWDVFLQEILIEKYNMIHIVVGKNNRFGYKGKGNSENLLQFCLQNNIGIDIIDDALLNNTVISSTYIKKLIKTGNISEVNNFLGHTYSISGTIIHGKQLGRTIDTPTINIVPAKDIVIPIFGVYATKTVICGKTYNSITNIGIKPTFNDETLIMETHIFDFNEDVYEQQATIKFYDFIRYEKKFKDIDSLKNQIDLDIKSAKTMLKEVKNG